MPINTEIKGNPESIRATTEWIRGSLAEQVQHVTTQVFTARNRAQSGWQGESGDAFSERTNTGGKQGDDFHEAIINSASQAEDVVAALERAQKDSERVRGEAAGAGLTVTSMIISDPVPAPPAPGPAPTGDAATPEATRGHQDAVAAQQTHAQQVKAFNKAKDQIEDIARRWRQQVDQASKAWQNMKNKAIFTDAGLAVSGVTTAMMAQRSRLMKSATGLETRAAELAERAKPGYSGKPPVGMYDNLDQARANTHAASAKNARAGDLKGRADKLGLKGGGALAAAGVAYDIAHGKPVDQAVVSGAGGFGASVAAGTLAGTAIGGPVGTVVGAVAGVAVGAFTSGAIDSLYQNGVDAVGTAIKDGGQAVLDTGAAIGGAAKDLGSAVAGGVKDVWNAIF